MAATTAVISDGVALRAMTVADLPAAHAMSVEMRWPHRALDWELALRHAEGLVAERDGQVVGSAGMHAAGPALRRRHVVMIGLSVVSGAQRQGVGTALMQALCDYADRWMGVLRIELTVYVDNAGAIALYRKFGFETEGRHRGYALRDGRYVDAFAMARLHPDPPATSLPGSGEPA